MTSTQPVKADNLQIFGKFADLELDIVGIVAILGEGSTSPNAQASALSWYHVLLRLYPAPQALLKNHQEKSLPVDLGVVVGAEPGRVKNELTSSRNCCTIRSWTTMLWSC